MNALGNSAANLEFHSPFHLGQQIQFYLRILDASAVGRYERRNYAFLSGTQILTVSSAGGMYALH